MKTITSIKYILVTVLAANVCFVQAQTNKPVVRTDYFKMQKDIADLNIFNPYRLPGRADPPIRPPRPTNPPVANSFALVGTMNYGEGDTAGIYAFFDGSSTKFRKAAVLNDSIAVYKIVAINRDSVTLVQNSNKVVLQVGDQMRDDTRGNWRAGGQAMGSYPSGSVGRTSTFGSTYDGGGRDRGRNNSGTYNSRTGADPYGTQFNRNQRNDPRGGATTATQDFPQDFQDPGIGALLDGTQVIIIPDFTAPADNAPPAE